jgi:hypothetical protein
MFTGILSRRRLVTLLIVVLAIALAAVSPALAAQANGPTAQTGSPTSDDAQPAAVAAQDTSNPYFSVETVTLGDGSKLERMIIAGPPKPPQGYELERPAAAMLAGDVLLPVPAYTWVFGCSAVSASMIAAYWDRNGFPNIYTGPTNGGVMPMDNSVWPTWVDVNASSYPGNPLTASRNGLDGRSARGSIDDYWVYYNSSVTANPDPYITNGWAQHTWGDAVGDYMWTSQSTQGNTDGATSFWGYTDATKLFCASMETGYDDGTVGRKHFYEARGYTIPATECYNQKTDNKAPGGFSFAQYQAKIDAGYPVFLNLAGHSIVGVGYNATTSPPTVYLNDTWSWTSGITHSMPWGGSYSGMELLSVSIADPALQPTTPAISINDVSVTEGQSGTVNAQFTVSLSAKASGQVSVNWVTANGTATAGSDYTAGGGAVTFAAGDLTKTVTVQVNGDTAAEPNETFYVNLSSPSGGTLADGQGVGTITNDDPPAAPTNLTATPISSTQINLAWTDNANSETGYYVERGVSGGGWTPIATLAANANSYANTGLMPGTTYGYRVRAYNAFGSSAYSNEPTATTPAQPKIHIGDLDGARTVSKKNWSASVTVAVHDASHKLMSGAVVTGSWSVGGTSSCTTSRSGVCTISKSGIVLGATSVTFTISGVTLAGYGYDSGANHDVDGGTNGTTITIVK